MARRPPKLLSHTVPHLNLVSVYGIEWFPLGVSSSRFYLEPFCFSGPRLGFGFSEEPSRPTCFLLKKRKSDKFKCDSHFGPECTMYDEDMCHFPPQPPPPFPFQQQNSFYSFFLYQRWNVCRIVFLRQTYSKPHTSSILNSPFKHALRQVVPWDNLSFQRFLINITE